MTANLLGNSTTSVTALGFGAAAIGNLYQAIDDRQATATVDAAWQAGIRYFDTAPHYGLGLSERRLGLALSAYPRDSYAISTKVGRLLVDNPAADAVNDRANGFDVAATHRRVWDFTTDGVRRSIDDSLHRLGHDRIDIVLIHDPDDSPDPQAALRHAYPALHELRDQGVIGAIGVGTKDTGILARFAADTDIDAVMLAGRYTLLDQPALDDLLPVCVRRGISVLNVGVFNSGLLATDWPDETRTYDYGTVPPEILHRAQRVAMVCRQHGVTLPHAALVFAGAHPVVTSVVVGAADPEHIDASAAWLAAPLPPAELWAHLIDEGLLRDDAPLPTQAISSTTSRSPLTRAEPRPATAEGNHQQ